MNLVLLRNLGPESEIILSPFMQMCIPGNINFAISINLIKKAVPYYLFRVPFCPFYLLLVWISRQQNKSTETSGLESTT
jgi:hypothetical protein